MKADSWRIKNIKVQGLLNTHDLYWELHPKVNILGGPNGSGKSTILHALKILFNRIPKDVESGEDILIHSEALFRSLTAELTSGIFLKVNREVTSSSEVVESSEQADTGKSQVRKVETIKFNGFSTQPSEVSAQIAKHILYVNPLDVTIRQFSNLLESADKDKRPTKTTLDLKLKNAINKRNQLFARLINKAMVQNDDEELTRLRDLFGRFEKAVGVFMPEYVILDSSALLFAPKDDKDVKISYLRLSTGEKQLLYLLLVVCNTLGESTILLMDEAEMGMHIDWKNILLRELLRINPNMQILAATHSPSLLSGWMENVKEISQLYTQL